MFRRSVAGGVVALAVGVITVVAAIALPWSSGRPTAATLVVTKPATSAARAADPEVAASRQARASGQPVEVAGEQTATSTVYAQPDGTMRAVFTAEPTRVRQGKAWVPLDTRLVRAAGGALTPAAGDQPLSFSAGRDAPLVTLGAAGHSLTLAWPAPLPAPTVSGSTATYGDVLPGVDLLLTATTDGFTDVLRVRDRAAGLRLLASPPALRITSSGLSIRPYGPGGLTAADATGAAVFVAPSALMWDATAGTDPAHADRTAPVGLALTGDDLVLRPDRTMLTDPATRYPVSIDPSFTANTLNWTNPLQQSPTVSFWNGQNLSDPNDPNGPVMVGLDPTFGTDARALFQMNTSSMNSKHILGATFRINEQWATSCTASEVDLWETGGISSSTTWNNQPGWTKKLASVTAAHKNGGSGSCGAAQIAFNATTAVQDAHNSNWPNLTLGLQAGDESDSNSWKRFAKNPTLQVDYNTVPTVGAQSTTPATTCVSGTSGPAANDPAINNATPTLAAVINDADSAETNETGSFQWQSWSGTAWVAAGSATDPTGRSPGTATSVTVSPALSNATTYRWRVQINDPLMSPYSGTDTSAWSGWCEFVVDTTPPAAPTASSTTYTSGCAPCGGVGTSGSFTLSDSSGDVTSYRYGFSDPPSVTLNPSAPGGSVSFAWTPSTGGPSTLFVQAQDAAGNISAATQYSFQVGSPAPVLGQWLLGDASGPTLADTTGNGHPATLDAGTLGAPSRVVGVGALSLSGASTNYAATSGPVLDTTRSFSVSAWVRATALSGDIAVLGQDGAHSSGFELQADAGCGCWRFVLPASDTTSPTTTVVNAAGPVTLGVWTHLAAAYDSAAGTASIYVNGSLAGSVSGLAPRWSAGGALAIGRDRWNDANANFFTGSLAAVQVWQRVLYAADVQALVDPTTTGLVEANSFSDPGSAGTQEFAAPDPLNLLHDLVLQGSATVPDSGAGYQGTGLLLDGDGYADSSINPTFDGTPEQVLHTDQSFTVSAWVNLAGTTLPTDTMTALSQLGNATSAFYLGYRVDGGSATWSFAMPGVDNDTATGWTEADSGALSTSVLNTWNHLTGAYDAVHGTLSLYVNDQLVATVARDSAATPWDAAGAFTVGAGQWSDATDPPALTDFWIGQIDEVRAYQGLLVAPLADWQFGGCTGSPLACPDSGSGQHPLTLSSSGATVHNGSLPSGAAGTMLTLDGSAGTAVTGTAVVDPSASFTVGAWVRLPSLPSSGAHTIISESGAHHSEFELRYDADRHAFCFALWGADSASASAAMACGPDAVAGQWTFVAGVYDAASATATLYTATPGNSPSAAATTSFTSPWAATGPVRVGAGYSDGTTTLFGGDVADVQIYAGTVGDLTTLA